MLRTVAASTLTSASLPPTKDLSGPLVINASYVTLEVTGTLSMLAITDYPADSTSPFITNSDGDPAECACCASWDSALAKGCLVPVRPWGNPRCNDGAGCGRHGD